MDVVELARSAFVRRFRWTNGHADFAGVLRDAEVLARLGPALTAPFAAAGITAVVALEARGFVLGALCARELSVGLVLARKAGAVHPGEKVEVLSAPDWRGRRLTFQLARVLVPTDRVLLVDDWIETGSQARAAKQAVEACGATVTGVSVVVDDTTADVRGELKVVGLLLSTDLPQG
jgi:adenine phosphoribosyltransferase